MIEFFKSADQSVFLFLNGFHCSFLDTVMFRGTQTTTWIPLYFLLLFLVIRRHRWQAIWVVLFASLMIVASDQLSNLFKEWIARPRPTHEPGVTGIHTVNGYLGGQFGFYSAHASNNLAIAVFLIIILGNPFRYFPLVILTWAFFMAYTRIYLGVHYPGDILAGWIAGGLLGWGFGQACSRIINNHLGTKVT
jgi:undecaprenyl-diphosphatase